MSAPTFRGPPPAEPRTEAVHHSPIFLNQPPLFFYHPRPASTMLNYPLTSFFMFICNEKFNCVHEDKAPAPIVETTWHFPGCTRAILLEIFHLAAEIPPPGFSYLLARDIKTSFLSKIISLVVVCPVSPSKWNNKYWFYYPSSFSFRPLLFIDFLCHVVHLKIYVKFIEMPSVLETSQYLFSSHQE